MPGGGIDPDLVPILLGVVGHRDLRPEDVDAVRLKIGAVIDRFRDTYPHTPLVMLNSLAEGADTVGAEVALERGVSVIAPLPMEVEAYRETFSTPEALHRFNELLARCDDTIVCRHLGSGEDTTDRQYARAGAAVVRYSHLVLAVWDGEDEGKAAGTARTVEYAAKGVPNDLLQDLEGGTTTPLDPPAAALVRQIPVGRQGRPSEGRPGEMKGREVESVGVLEMKKGKADLGLPGSEERVFRRFEGFNRTVLARRPAAGGDWLEAATYRSGAGEVSRPLVPDDVAEGLPGGLQVLRRNFAMADALAAQFQRISTGTLLNFVLCGGFLVAVLHEFFITLMADDPDSEFRRLLGGLYLALLAITWIVSQMAVWLRWQDQYQDIRTLAEGARVQFFWLLAGIRTPVVNFHLRKQRDELDWIRSVLRMWYLRGVIGGGVLAETGEREVQAIRRDWLKGQRDYFRAKAQLNGKLDRRWSLAVQVIGGILLVFSLLAVFIKSLLWVALMALFGSLALLFNSYREIKATAEHHKSYSRMAVVFDRAWQAFDSDQCLDESERVVLEELGRESLTETGDWLLLHRRRPIKI